MACNTCGQGCDCRIIAGSGAIVRGTGTNSDPFVISLNANTFAVEDTSCINLDLTGAGTSTDPYTLTAEPIIHPSPDNILVCDGDGLLVDCDTVVTCVGNNLGCGLEFNNGLICVMISEDDGNQIECRDDGLYASFDCEDLGCGLTLDTDGNIAVNLPQGTHDGALLCDPATGQIGVNAHCGLRVDGANRLRTDIHQLREQIADGDRFDNRDIPNGEVNGLEPVVDPALATLTDPQCITFQNDLCAPVQGFVVVRFQWEAVVGPDRDIEVDLLQFTDGGDAELAEELFRHYHEQGGRQIFSGYGERTVALGDLNPGNSIEVCYQLSFHRARNPGDLTGDPAAEARLLSWSMTVQGILNWND